VAQYNALLDAVEDNGLLREVQQLLNLGGAAWDVTRDHARMAVPDDSNARVWWMDDAKTKQLVFDCKKGSVVLEMAVGEGPCLTHWTASVFLHLCCCGC
jgi:hypothetical protein